MTLGAIILYGAARDNMKDNLLFTRDHVWIHVTGQYAVLGVTEFFTPEGEASIHVDSWQKNKIKVGDDLVTIDYCRECKTIQSPLYGEMSAKNGDVISDAYHIENDPYGVGWLLRIDVDWSKKFPHLLRFSEYANWVSLLRS